MAAFDFNMAVLRYIFLCLLQGSISFFTVGLAQENNQCVNRTVGQSAVLSLVLPKGASDTDILWYRSDLVIASVNEGMKKINYVKQFDGRLDVYLNGSFIIRHLQNSDSGTYIGRAVFGNYPQVKQEFILCVSDDSSSFRMTWHVISVSALPVILLLGDMHG